MRDRRRKRGANRGRRTLWRGPLAIAGAGLFALLFLGSDLPGRGARAQEVDPESEVQLEHEYIQERAKNAVYRARLSLSKEGEPYLILDIPEREVRLELQGVTLTTVSLREARLNRMAKEISRDTTRIAFCEIPFVLQDDRWYEEVPTLALKDSAAVMDRPDTTGALVERIRSTPILSMLQFDRNLVVAFNGVLEPTTPWGRYKQWARRFWDRLRAGSAEASLVARRRASIFVELQLEPGHVRSLAPTLTEGTKLVLRF